MDFCKLILCYMCVINFHCSDTSNAGNINDKFNEFEKKLITLLDMNRKLEERVLQLEETMHCNCSQSSDIKDNDDLAHWNNSEYSQDGEKTLKTTIKRLSLKVSKQNSEFSNKINENWKITSQNRYKLEQFSKVIFSKLLPILPAMPYIDLIPTIEKKLESLENITFAQEKLITATKEDLRSLYNRVTQAATSNSSNGLSYDEIAEIRKEVKEMIYQISFTCNQTYDFLHEEITNIGQKMLLFQKHVWVNINETEEKLNNIINNVSGKYDEVYESVLAIKKLYSLFLNKERELEKAKLIFNLNSTSYERDTNLRKGHKTLNDIIKGMESNSTSIEGKSWIEVYKHFNELDMNIDRGVRYIFNETLSYRLLNETIHNVMVDLIALHTATESTVGMLRKFQRVDITVTNNEKHLKDLELSVSNISTKVEEEIKTMSEKIKQLGNDMRKSEKKHEQNSLYAEVLSNSNNSKIGRMNDMFNTLISHTKRHIEIFHDKIENVTAYFDQEFYRAHQIINEMNDKIWTLTDTLSSYDTNNSAAFQHMTERINDAINKTQSSATGTISKTLAERLHAIEHFLQNELLNSTVIYLILDNITSMDQQLYTDMNNIRSILYSVEQKYRNMSALNAVKTEIYRVMKTYRESTNRISNIETRISRLEQNDQTRLSLYSIIEDRVSLLQTRMNSFETAERNIRVRLMEGESSYGRLEVNLGNGAWGTVCDDYFTAVEATVVCRQLGYRAGIARTGAYYGEGYLDIIMDDVRCTGQETTIQQCKYVGKDEEDCTHKEDVGVICS